eukprot:TRINITY_DN489_c0_g1_i2.p1 TRINITY_DN489_c0_g1~~TRINITY_DN489_c0_g1_i2.p1  ORF type:complete len:202 (+),score=56.22 TRINITY_DN489_c0_g1_i2:80-685(+)
MALSRSVGRVAIQNTAFFLCDVQERFRDLIQFMPSVIHVSSQMTRAAKILNIPLIVTEQYPKALGRTVPEIDLKEFQPAPFEKFKFSMWTPEVEQHVTQNLPLVKSIALFGIEAHVCVLQTAMDLVERGYEVHLIADGTSSTRQADRMMAFERLKQMGVFMTTSESFLFQLMGGAKFEKFREISNLSKEKRPESGLIRSAL